MTRIKVCGITRLEDALAATEAGADALGFNFSEESPRRVSPDVARSIIEHLPPFINCTGIFVEQDAEEINHICSYCRIHTSQLHSERYTAEVAKAVTASKVIKVFRAKEGFSASEVMAFSAATAIHYFLFDTYRPGISGGTGARIETSQATEIFEEIRERTYSILAGGLNSENVGEAIKAIRPYAVDTASGVESEPGIKDHLKIRAFIKAVRIADRDIRSGCRPAAV